MQDRRALVDAEGGLYEAALAPDAETRWMNLLRDAIGAEHAVLTEVVDGRARAWHSTIDTGMLPLVRRLSETTIYDPSLSRMPTGAACRMTDFFPLRDLMRHDLFHQIVRPLHGGLALTYVCPPGPARAAIAVCRDAGSGLDYTDDEIAVVQPLLDHLHNAMRIRRRIAEQARDAACVLSALDGVADGILVLDCRGGIRFANAAARAILAQADAVTVDRGGLAAVGADSDRRLRGLLQQAAHAGTPSSVPGDAACRRLNRIAIPRPAPRHPLFVRVAPAAMLGDAHLGLAAVVLVLIDPDRAAAGDADLLREAYGLTTREAQLALLLADGCTLVRSAARLGIGEGTARQYLKHVFAKTGVGRQAELVALVRATG